MRILYIAGSGRSGSTLLDRLLGLDESFHASGEIDRIWRAGVIDNRMCSCGRVFSECDRWSRVVGETGQALSKDTAGKIVAFHNRVFPATGVWRLASEATRRNLERSAPREYYPAIQSIYDSVAAAIGPGAIMVDSSKLPMYLYFLSRATSHDIRVIHLVRDPRAVAHSWGRPARPDPDGRTEMPQMRPAKSALSWSLINASTDWTLRSLGLPALRLRYEDLAADPEGALDRVREFAGVSGARPDEFTKPASAAGGASAVLKLNHIVSGNPVRFQKGVLKIAEDRDWETAMNEFDKRLVYSLCGPVAHRYGYRHHGRPANLPLGKASVVADASRQSADEGWQ